MSQKQYNYIRSLRKRVGLSRTELAALLGIQRPNHVSRIELNRCVPSVETILACEIIFRQSLDELLPRLRDEVECIVIIRAQELYREIEQRADPHADRLLAILTAIMEHKDPVPTPSLWKKK